MAKIETNTHSRCVLIGFHLDKPKTDSMQLNSVFTAIHYYQFIYILDKYLYLHHITLGRKKLNKNKRALAVADCHRHLIGVFV